MKTGRPTKYTPEVFYKDIELYKFKSERKLNKYLLEHVDAFMRGVFNEKVLSATDKKSVFTY